MSIKFRKPIRLIRGLWLNLSKGFPSISIGGRGLTTNIGKRGVRTTIGIPGSGLSYATKTEKWQESNSLSRTPSTNKPLPSGTEDSGEKTLKKIWPLVFAPLCGVVLLWFALVHGNRRESRSVVTTATPELTTPRPAATPELIQSRPTPTPELRPEVRRAELVVAPEVRRAELVATPQVRRAELVATPALTRTHPQMNQIDIRPGRQ
jgi:hypothetical protein